MPCVLSRIWTGVESVGKNKTDESSNSDRGRSDTLPWLLCELCIHSKRCFIDFYVLLVLLSVCNVTMCESDDIIVLRSNRCTSPEYALNVHILHCVLCARVVFVLVVRSGTSNDGYTRKKNVCTLSCIFRWRVLAISSNSMWRAFDFRRRQSHAFAFHAYVRRNLCVYLLIGLSIAAKTTEDARLPSNYTSEQRSPALSRHSSPLLCACLHGI